MKKIVGIFAAAAVLATSVFAADVSAATKINGSVFAFGADESISMLKEGNDSHDYANPNLAFNISDDRAGASIKLTSDGGTKEVKLTSQTIWFKPVEVLKISAGNYDVALNKEQIDWTQSVTGIGGNGFLASVNTNGFGLDIGFDCNEKFWMSKAKDADVALTQFFLKAGYSADFGTIGAYAEFNRLGAGRRTWAYHDAFFGLGDNAVAGIAKKDGAVSDIHFGAGYKNNFNGINVFANVAGFMADKFEWIRPEIYVSGSADAFGYNAFIAPIIFVNGDLNRDAEVELVAKLTYAMDGITPYFYFKDENLLNKTFTAQIKVGATGSVGLVGYNIWAQVDVADKVGFSVPFELTASF
jgi:hypothetical protein